MVSGRACGCYQSTAVGEYYPDYRPKNVQHFQAMLTQFRGCRSQDEMDLFAFMWVCDPEVDRQDIVVAIGRVEREARWPAQAQDQTQE